MCWVTFIFLPWIYRCRILFTLFLFCLLLISWERPCRRSSLPTTTRSHPLCTVRSWYPTCGRASPHALPRFLGSAAVSCHAGGIACVSHIQGSCFLFFLFLSTLPVTPPGFVRRCCSGLWFAPLFGAFFPVVVLSLPLLSSFPGGFGFRGECVPALEKS